MFYCEHNEADISYAQLYVCRIPWHSLYSQNSPGRQNISAFYQRQCSSWPQRDFLFKIKERPLACPLQVFDQWHYRLELLVKQLLLFPVMQLKVRTNPITNNVNSSVPKYHPSSIVVKKVYIIIKIKTAILSLVRHCHQNFSYGVSIIRILVLVLIYKKKDKNCSNTFCSGYEEFGQRFWGWNSLTFPPR